MISISDTPEPGETVGDLVDAVQEAKVIHAYGYRIEYHGSFTLPDWRDSNA